MEANKFNNSIPAGIDNTFNRQKLARAIVNQLKDKTPAEQANLIAELLQFIDVGFVAALVLAYDINRIGAKTDGRD